jgi:hypothetical protein
VQQPRGGQQLGAGLGEWDGLVDVQGDLAHGGGQRGAGQVLAEQPAAT